MPKDNLKMILEPKNATETTVDFYIYGDIVSSEYQAYKDGDAFPSAIKGMVDYAGGRDINLYINSGGGSVFAGMAIGTMLKRYEGKTRAYIDGVCASIATIIALSCDEVYIAEGALWMHHQAWGEFYLKGNANAIMEKADEHAAMLKAINDSMLSVYASKLAEGADIEKVRGELDSGKDKWLTSEEAIAYFNIQKVAGKEAVAYCESDFIAIPKGEATGKTKKIESEDDEMVISFEWL